MKTRIFLLMALFCLGLYLFINMMLQKRTPTDQFATWRNAGTEEERYLKFMNHILPNGKFPSYTELKEAVKVAAKGEAVTQEGSAKLSPPAKVIYDPNVTNFSQREVEEEIRLRRERKETYKKTVADRDRALMKRRMNEFEDPGAQGTVLPSVRPKTKASTQNGPVVFFH